MLGREYVIDHCILTLKQERETIIFKNYVADSLTNIGQMIAGLGQGKYEVPRYAELVEPANNKEERTADEVIVSISDKLARL